MNETIVTCGCTCRYAHTNVKCDKSYMCICNDCILIRICNCKVTCDKCMINKNKHLKKLEYHDTITDFSINNESWNKLALSYKIMYDTERFFYEK